MSIGMWRIISTLMVVSYGGPQLCGAQDLTCTVTQAGDHIVYKISHVSQATNVEALECYYSWTNKSNHVLANQVEKIAGLVKRNDIDILMTSECFDDIILTRSCMSEVIERTAYCSTNCSLMKINEDKAKKLNEGMLSWIAVVVILLLVGLLGFLGCQFREKIKMLCSCGDYYAVRTSTSY